MRGLVVSLDGPGSSGKSSVGAAAALQMGYRFLDTGVLYRALAWLSVTRDIDPQDQATLVSLVPELQLGPDPEGRIRRVSVGGMDVTDGLHEAEVDRRVSEVARQPQVRAALLGTQRELGAHGPIIIAGRDIGTVVLPDADLKLYLDVSLEERARRRAAERGVAADSGAAAAILEDLRRRDGQDSGREVAPLRVPDGAVLMRSDGRRFEETVAEMVRIVREHEARHAQDGAGHRPPRLAPYPRFVAWLCRVALRCIARIHIEGLEGLPPSGPLIVAANHMSNVDPPLVGGWLGPALGRRPVFLAKEALFVAPLAPLLRSLGAVPVKTGGSDIDAYRAAKAVLEAGGVVSIMPEGTRSHDGHMTLPMAGVSLLATRTGSPILPVGISGTDRLLGRGARLPRLRTPVTLRVGRPFTLSPPQTGARRDGLRAADEQLMRRIAALVDPRHRGDWTPWPDD